MLVVWPPSRKDAVDLGAMQTYTHSLVRVRVYRRVTLRHLRHSLRPSAPNSASNAASRPFASPCVIFTLPVLVLVRQNGNRKMQVYQKGEEWRWDRCSYVCWW